MARKIIWLPPAYEDLEGIWLYIARDSQMYARGMIRRILQAARDLLRFPQIGRMVPEWDDVAIRERIVGPYRLIYRVDRERIIILAVIHGARILHDDVKDRS